jgi:hypothetical protein
VGAVTDQQQSGWKFVKAVTCLSAAGGAIESLRAENRVLRARLGPKRLRFTDAERRLLAEKGKPLGRKLLADVASLATPGTILR